MIHLHVEDYCQNCPEFKPETSTVEMYDALNKYLDTIVYCEHQKRCNIFMRYLEGKLKESDKK